MSVLDAEDILSEALEFLGGKPVIDKPFITYGPLSLTLPAKEGKAITLLADHLFSPGLFLAERIERGLVDLKGKTVLELGAGSALPSLLSAIKNSPSLVVVTDYPDPAILKNLQANVDRNRAHFEEGCDVRVSGYDWGKDPSEVLNLLPAEKRTLGYDILVLSDLLHFDTSHDDLIRSIQFFLAKKASSRTYIGAGKYTRGPVIESFLRKAKAIGLDLEEIGSEPLWMGTLPVDGLDIDALSFRKANCRYWVGKCVQEVLE